MPNKMIDRGFQKNCELPVQFHSWLVIADTRFWRLTEWPDGEEMQADIVNYMLQMIRKRKKRKGVMLCYESPKE